MHNKKVLIFLPALANGGVSKIVSDYINNINNDNLKIDIMTFCVRDDIYFKNVKNNILYVGKTKNIFKRLYREIKIIKKGKYDVIHINGDNFGRLIECISAKIAGVKKIIIHSHSSSSKKANSLITKNIIKLLRKMYDFLATDYFACSDKAAKWLFSKKIYNSKKYTIINNGIDVEKFKFNEKKRIDLRKKLGIDKNQMVIGFVGRLADVKNPLFLIDILKECKKKYNNVMLMIIGTGELYDEMNKKISEFGLKENVIFVGNKKNVYDYYNVMDCFVLPSKYEGLPIVSVEAQTNGLKTFLSNNITQETKITDLVKFLPIKDYDETKWAKQILKLNQHKETNDRKEYARKVIKANFDIKNVVNQLCENYYSD